MGMTPNYDPFKRRDKIGRTPMVSNGMQSLNDFNGYKEIYSPSIRKRRRSAPASLLKNRYLPEIQEPAFEPGSIGMSQRKKRRSSGVSTGSQPEGIYSPIPQSKILSEFNASIKKDQAYSPFPACWKSVDDEKSQSPERFESFSFSELPRNKNKNQNIDKLRSDIRAEIERMDNEITRELNQSYSTNPEQSLLSKMSELQIKPNDDQRFARNEDNLLMVSNKKKEKKNLLVMVIDIAIDRWCNLLNFIFILFMLALYWNVVEFQWMDDTEN